MPWEPALDAHVRPAVLIARFGAVCRVLSSALHRAGERNGKGRCWTGRGVRSRAQAIHLCTTWVLTLEQTHIARVGTWVDGATLEGADQAKERAVAWFPRASGVHLLRRIQETDAEHALHERTRALGTLSRRLLNQVFRSREDADTPTAQAVVELRARPWISIRHARMELDRFSGKRGR